MWVRPFFSWRFFFFLFFKAIRSRVFPWLPFSNNFSNLSTRKTLWKPGGKHSFPFERRRHVATISRAYATNSPPLLCTLHLRLRNTQFADAVLRRHRSCLCSASLLLDLRRVGVSLFQPRFCRKRRFIDLPYQFCPRTVHPLRPLPQYNKRPLAFPGPMALPGCLASRWPSLLRVH